MKLFTKILVIPMLTFVSLLANANINITNGTGCLLLPDNTVTYTKPVTIYAFVYGSDGSKTYSGTAVNPGDVSVSIPTSPAPGITPTQQESLLGTDPHDAPPHITGYVTGTPGTRPYLVVQMYYDFPGNGCSNPNYPCVQIASAQTASQCTSLLTGQPSLPNLSSN